LRPESISYVRGAMESVVLLLVAGLPWAFGGVDPIYELVIAVGLALILLCWACVACLNGRLSFSRCPITVVLGGLFLLGSLQLVPLPPMVLKLVSPGAAGINSEMLPAEPEQLTTTEPAPTPSALHPVSVYAHATRVDLFHWLEVLLLFAAVRHQLASTASFRRLAIVAVVTGIAISLFGLFQTLRTGGQKVYGFETAGNVFGPFINRNHAACFLNMCIGLAVGLLLYQGTDVTEYKRRAIQKPNALEEQEQASVFSLFTVLHSPLQLWILVALTILVAGVMCTLSRGGVACLALALFGAFAMRMTWPPRVGRLEYLILPAILLTGLLAWIGIRPLETKLATLWKSDVFAYGRWQIWANLITLTPSFPVFGSGYGTLQYVEPLTRRQADLMQLPGVLIDHAHNDYLEGLIEGGLLRLGLTSLLVVLVFVFGFRALRRYAGRKPAAWAFGGMIAFLAIAFHSCVDFSLQTPAVACLAVIVCAQFVSLNRSDPNMPPSAAHPTVVTLRFGTVGVALVSLTALAVSGIVILHAWKAEQSFRYHVAAFRSLQRVTPPDIDQAIVYLESACQVDPTDADLQLELGQLFLDRTDVKHRLEDSIVPGIRHMILARNLCPLLARPQMRLAAHASELAKADPPEMYWERAARLAPSDPDFWYLRGMYMLKENKPDSALQYWHRSLELSPVRLKEIVDAGYPRFGVEGLLTNILPENAELLVKAVGMLPATASKEDLKRIYRAAGRLLDARGDDLTANEYYLKARCAEYLGENDKALRAYKFALDMNSTQHEWRWQYARLLHRTGRLSEARRELRELLKVWPGRPDVTDELEAVDREILIDAK
jgi:tetratricopeptide (TPR) repeat protein